MFERLRARPALLAVLLLGTVLLVADAALAGDPRTGRIDIEARLEPADLGPGQAGRLVIEATLLPKLHIYATGEQGMKYAPLPAAGVTYHMDTLSFTQPHAWTDEAGDSHDVWEESFEFAVKVTLAEDVAPGTRLGMSFTYYGCNDRGCYPAVEDHVAAVALPGGGPRLVQAPPFDEGGAELAVDEEKGEVVVTFTPSFGWHMYGPGDESGSIQVEVVPQEADGVTWGEPDYADEEAAEIHEAYAVRIPFERADGAKEIAVEAKWQACQGDAVTGTCNEPRSVTLRAVWGDGAAPVVPDVTAPPAAEAPIPQGDLRFPVKEEDELGVEEESKIAKALRDNAILAYLIIFAAGLGLAFTPCVLPLLPITVSVISGGRADIPKKRLTVLLLTYVLGLCLTFAAMGVAAALAGRAMSEAFASPVVIWGISIFFVVLGFFMLGIYELQPPSWLTNLQGGAHKRAGSVVGAFLFGMLGAVIASPCTGPAIASLLIVVAESRSITLGLTTFFTLGLGMGAVLFAAGSLNFMLKPGPWMIWVRYVFGVLIIAAALFFLASGGRITQKELFIGGFVIAVLAWIGIAWHLVKKEGEEKGPARTKGAVVAVMLIVVTGLVGLLTRRPDNLLDWTYAEDPDHLVQLVAEANAEGKPAVVDFWGEWCYYCKKYDDLIASNPDLRDRFERVARIKVDLTDDAKRWDMRHAVGVTIPSAPVLVFIDRAGVIRRKADVLGWDSDPKHLKDRVDLILRKAPKETSGR